MALIPGLPKELGLTVLELVEDRADIVNLRFASIALAATGKHLLLRHLTLRKKKNMAKKLCALLKEPDLRQSIRRIQFHGSIDEDDDNDDDDDDNDDDEVEYAILQSWKTDLRVCISDALPQADMKILKLCGVIGDETSVPRYRSTRRFGIHAVLCNGAEAIAAAITLLCPRANTVDISRCYLGSSTDLDNLWQALVDAGPAADVKVPVTAIALAPDNFESAGLFRGDRFHSLLRTPAERLDIVGTEWTERVWTWDGLRTPGVLEQVEDIRLDPDYPLLLACKWRPNHHEIRVRRRGFGTYGLETRGMYLFAKSMDLYLRGMYLFAKSMDLYLRDKCEHLKRLHFSYRSGALRWLRGSWWRSMALLAHIPLLANLEHLEADLVSLFGSPLRLSQLPRGLVGLLPESLRVLRLSDVWCDESEPCSHRARAYRRGLYNILVNLVEARGNLESVAIRFPPEEEYEWREGLGLGTELLWTRNSGIPMEDAFGALKEGTSEKDVYREYCRGCKRGGSWEGVRDTGSHVETTTALINNADLGNILGMELDGEGPT